MIILGIETSCDETAVAIIDGSRPKEQRILSSLVLSQIEEHRAFGGVVPEVAARAHIDHIHTLIKAAVDDAKITFDDLNAVASTCGPGLIGGVMIGMMAAKSISAAKNIPFIAINHLEGHALTPRLTDDTAFPYLLLLVSGGHTQILVAEGVGNYKRWGTTLDDAAGECFDKSAKIMGLPYPGGPEIQKIAQECKNPQAAQERFPLPTPMKGRKELDFSFSGLKTAIRQTVESLPPANEEGDLKRKDIADLAYAFQETVAEIIADRCTRAIERFKSEYEIKTPTLVVSGGVAANTAIRQKIDQLCQQHDIKAYAPPIELCGDNAAMIAWAGYEHLQNGQTDPLDFKARPRWPLDPHAEPRHGGGVKA